MLLGLVSSEEGRIDVFQMLIRSQVLHNSNILFEVTMRVSRVSHRDRWNYLILARLEPLPSSFDDSRSTACPSRWRWD